MAKSLEEKLVEMQMEGASVTQILEAVLEMVEHYKEAHFETEASCKQLDQAQNLIFEAISAVRRAEEMVS